MLSRKTREALERARKAGVARFEMAPDELNGCYFTLPLVELVEEETLLYQKQAELSKQAANGVSIHANRFLAISHDLAEIQFCLGLFAIASKYPDMFAIDDDTSAEDIYIQLEEHQDKLSVKDRACLCKAGESLKNASIKIGKAIVHGVKAVNKVTYAAGVAAFNMSRKGLNKFGKWLAKVTESNK